MKAVKVKLEDLKLDAENVRAHGNENIEMIRRSLEESSQYRPLIVDERSMVVKVGNGRLTAMRQLGWKECWCILMDFSQHEGLEVVDNRLNELSRWADESIDDWLLNDKGLEWWGVDSKKSAALARKKKASERVLDDRPEDQSIPVCPCCGRPLHKTKAVLQ